MENRMPYYYLVDWQLRIAEVTFGWATQDRCCRLLPLPARRYREDALLGNGTARAYASWLAANSGDVVCSYSDESPATPLSEWDATTASSRRTSSVGCDGGGVVWALLDASCRRRRSSCRPRSDRT